MAQWRTSRGGQYDWDRVRNRPALHERHGRSGARFVRAIPDSCWNFPIGARHSRFVLKFPDSCARFPIGARDSQSRSWAGCRVGRFAPPPGANRSTPPASTGANRSSAGALLPDSCTNFPIGAFWRFGTRCAFTPRHEPSREVGRHEDDRSRTGSLPDCKVFCLFPHSLPIPTKGELS